MRRKLEIGLQAASNIFQPTILIKNTYFIQSICRKTPQIMFVGTFFKHFCEKNILVLLVSRNQCLRFSLNIIDAKSYVYISDFC